MSSTQTALGPRRPRMLHCRGKARGAVRAGTQRAGLKWGSCLLFLSRDGEVRPQLPGSWRLVAGETRALPVKSRSCIHSYVGLGSNQSTATDPPVSPSVPVSLSLCLCLSVCLSPHSLWLPVSLSLPPTCSPLLSCSVSSSLFNYKLACLHLRFNH